MVVDYLTGLNPEQRAAVEALNGPVRILAGAGTGKTRTITHRIAHQIHTGTFASSAIMAVTFTERAAAELKERLIHLGVPPNIRAATVHSAAWAQVRYFWSHLSSAPLPEVLPNAYRVVAPMAKRLGVEAADLLQEINWAANANLTPEQVAKSSRDELILPSDLAEVIMDYTDAKQVNGWIDYHDMLRLAIKLGETPAIDEIRERYQAFTVDEFQDTNALQWELLRTWDGGRGEVCVVGDPCQSIFGFTGANAMYLNNFPQTYPQATSVMLTHSYRSTGEILAFTNRILPDGADLIAQPGFSGPEPKIYSFGNETQEREGIIQKLTSLIDKGVPARDIAILVRLNNQLADWEQALWEAGIPTVIPGEGSFYGRRDVVAVIQALAGAFAQEQAREAAGPPQIGVAPPPNEEQRLAHFDRLIKQGLRWSPDSPIPLGAKARETWQNVATIRTQGRQLISAGYGVDQVIEALQERMNRQAHTQEEAVSLMTLHKSKGTEFRVVVIPACERGFLPVTQAKTPEEKTEEQRLFYVGCTRAKQLLLISWAELRTHPVSGKAQKRKPSVFIPGLGGPTKNPKKERPKELPETEVVQRLREWRYDRAKADEVAAFMVMSNATLLEIVEFMPTNLKELRAVNGMGPKKIALYGEEILNCLAETPADSSDSGPETPANSPSLQDPVDSITSENSTDNPN